MRQIEIAAGAVLNQAVLRNHQGKPPVDNGLRRKNFFHVPNLGKAELEGKTGGFQPLLPEIVQGTAVDTAARCRRL